MVEKPMTLEEKRDFYKLQRGILASRLNMIEECENIRENIKEINELRKGKLPLPLPTCKIEVGNYPVIAIPEIKLESKEDVQEAIKSLNEDIFKISEELMKRK